jgi:hypothetical protein
MVNIKSLKAESPPRLSYTAAACPEKSKIIGWFDKNSELKHLLQKT